MKKIIVAVLIIAVIATIISLTVLKKTAVQEPEKIRVGYLSLASSLPFFVAKEKGFFMEEGIEIEAFKFKSSNETSDALLSGRIDATSIAALSVWMAIEQRQPHTLKVFLMTYASKDTTVHRILAKKDSGIKSLSDLKNKKLGTFPGLQMKVFTKLVLEQFLSKESVDKIELVPLSPPLQKDALASGRIDALFCLEPVGTIAEEAGIGTVFEVNPLYKYILKPFPTAASVVSTKFIGENPKTTKKYINAIYRAIEYIQVNPNKARELLPNYTSLSSELSQKVGIYDFWTSSNKDDTAIQHLADLYLKYKILKGSLDTKTLFLEN